MRKIQGFMSSVTSLLVTGVICLLTLAILASSSLALAEQVNLSRPVTTFSPSALGGIREIVRYEVAHPNQTEIDYLLLTESSNKPDATPTAVQVEDTHGDAVKLSDDFWPDCTIARVAIFRQGHEVLIMKAYRADDGRQIMAGSLAQPGPMKTQIYRRQDGGEPGQSSPMFKADSAPIASKPVCTDDEVQQLLRDVAVAAFKGSSR